MTWQPIETAPKDGTHILVYGPSAGYDEDAPPLGFSVAHWYDDGVNELGWRGIVAGDNIDSYSDLDEDTQPTHWQPLPEPPA